MSALNPVFPPIEAIIALRRSDNATICYHYSAVLTLHTRGQNINHMHAYPSKAVAYRGTGRKVSL